ncbi:MAG: nucleotide exchange factor GrpE [Ruminococcaceae bacterium]|nr:nucleotide exchange factor GrpE [Oscillospiraceae bacterium]
MRFQEKENVRKGQKMAKNKKNQNEEPISEEVMEETTETTENTEEIEVEIDPEVKKLTEKCDELQDKYLRLAAEYDNFRKRSVKEKELAYLDAFARAVSGMLPIVDNIDRATAFADAESEMGKGIIMLQKQVYDVLEKMGVKAMESDGAEFNPELHNAVMHDEDDSDNKNIIVETFQKGYIYGDKVIRHAMVKVLN